MFVGAVNRTLLAHLQANASAFSGKRVVVGCSGSFGVELALQEAGAQVASIHSNDVSLYSGALGAFFSNGTLSAQPRADAPEWLKFVWGPGARSVAVLEMLLEMLPFEKQKNAHQRRMWQGYLHHLAHMVEEVEERAGALPGGVTSYFAGDVGEHFRAQDGSDAVFLCFAPTYAGGYEKMYKRLHELFDWTPPQYGMLDEAARDGLLAWLADGRRYFWYDDRKLPGMSPLIVQERGSMRTIYIYANALEKPAYYGPYIKRHNLPLPLANENTVLTPGARVELLPIKTSDLADYKDQFLAKGIDHSPGMWAFAVTVGDAVVGFIEFTRSKFGGSSVYVNSDFAVPNTRYARLSKLMVMLLVSKDVHAFLERKLLMRVTGVMTTAFTERPVSMKYRGVLELVKRGVKKEDGRHFLNYEGTFTDKSAQEVYAEWLNKYGSKQVSKQTSTAHSPS